MGTLRDDHTNLRKIDFASFFLGGLLGLVATKSIVIRFLSR